MRGSLTFAPATADDAETLADLRAAAMRPSLEAVGRFDPERARRRLLDRFDPSQTWKILRDGRLIGFFALLRRSDCFYLDHLYVDARAQGSGAGAAVVAHAKKAAAAAGLPLRLTALNDSPASAFYRAQGFHEIDRDALDTAFEFCAPG